jgi:hypothetical protein
MRSSDIAGVLVFTGVVLFEWWLIRRAVKTGKWRYRGGVVHRETRPRLFRGIVAFASLWVAFSILTLLSILDHEIICRGRGIPIDCYRNQIDDLRGRALGSSATADLKTLGGDQ